MNVNKHHAAKCRSYPLFLAVCLFAILCGALARPARAVVTYGPFSGWTAGTVSVGSDNTSHLLWSGAGQTLSLWSVNPAGAYTHAEYGPYAGWSPTVVADGPDGMTRVLWTNANGQISIWSVDPSSGAFTQNSFGPYAGWTATGLSVGADNTTHVLWSGSSGAAGLWNYQTTTGGFTDAEYGPYSGWSVKAVADGPDGMTRLLWTNSNGQASIWNLNAGSGAFTQHTFGPYAGWTAASLSAAPGGVTHILWTSGGQASLWNYQPADGSFTTVQYGPYSGWTAKTVADGSDGLTRVLWTNTNGMASLWSVDLRPPLPYAASLTAAPNPVNGGQAAIGTVTLTTAASSGGTTVTLTSDNALATVPASLVVPAGATSATFPITTGNPLVAGSVTANLTAAANGAAQTTALSIAHVGPVSGLYRLTTRGQQSLALDVVGFGNANGTKVQIWNAGQTCNQQWLVDQQSDGTYKIHAYSGSFSDQMLDDTNGGTANGNTVLTYQDNGNDAQRWYFVDIGGGFYRIVPKNAGLTSAQTLDLSGGNGATAGSVTAIYSYFGGDNQVFRLDPPGAPQPTPGVYRITTRGHPELSLDVYGFGNSDGTNVQIWTANDTDNQQWLVQTTGSNIYSIAAYSAMNSQQMLDDAGGATANGTNVTTYTDNGTNNQRWLFQDIGGGYSRIVPLNAAGTLQTLDVRNGNNAKAGDTLNIYGYYGGDNQVFQLVDPGPSALLVNAKKGMGGKEWAGWGIHNSWYYTWGSTEPTDAPPGTEFVPMEWGYYGGDNSAWIQSTAAQPGVKNFLAFNEPDQTGQSNLTVPYALTGYQYLAAANLPIGSPACADDNDSWFSSFMAGVASNKYRLDFIAVHCYINDPNSFESYVTNLHNVYWQYPLWITEMAPADWSGTNQISVAQATAFMQQVVPWLNSQWYVARYAWYTGASPSDPTLGSSALVNDDGSLTNLGILYGRM